MSSSDESTLLLSSGHTSFKQMTPNSSKQPITRRFPSVIPAKFFKSSQPVPKLICTSRSDTKVKVSTIVRTEVKNDCSVSSESLKMIPTSKKTSVKIGRLFTMTGLAYLVCIYFFLISPPLLTVDSASLNPGSDALPHSPMVIMARDSSADEDVRKLREERQDVFEIVAATAPTTTIAEKILAGQKNNNVTVFRTTAVPTTTEEVDERIESQQSTPDGSFALNDDEFLGEYVTGEHTVSI